jgi:hypothetical protein
MVVRQPVEITFVFACKGGRGAKTGPDLPPKKWTGLGRHTLSESWADVAQGRMQDKDLRLFIPVMGRSFSVSMATAVARLWINLRLS